MLSGFTLYFVDSKMTATRTKSINTKVIHGSIDKSTDMELTQNKT